MNGWICKYCGSKNTKTIGGDYGDPFDRTPETVICEDCGKVIFSEEEQAKIDVDKILKQALNGKTIIDTEE